MIQLEEIKALERDLFIAGLPSDNALKLLAALEAVELALSKMNESRSESRTNRYDKGIDAGFEIAADVIRAAITEALV